MRKWIVDAILLRNQKLMRFSLSAAYRSLFRRPTHTPALQVTQRRMRILLNAVLLALARSDLGPALSPLSASQQSEPRPLVTSLHAQLIATVKMNQSMSWVLPFVTAANFLLQDTPWMRRLLAPLMLFALIIIMERKSAGPALKVIIIAKAWLLPVRFVMTEPQLNLRESQRKSAPPIIMTTDALRGEFL